MNPEQQEVLEQFPSQEKIKSAFEAILGGAAYTELRLRVDAEGVGLYEISVVLENGERREYNYQKAAYDYKEQSLPAASIHVTDYDADGIPYGGQCVANYLDGTWRYVPETA